MITSLIPRAIRVAIQAHGDQKRKHSNIPYIVHPARVAEKLSREGKDEYMVCAGYLHDVLEDTPMTAHELGRDFPHDVVDLVVGMTNPKYVGNRAARKQACLERLKLQPRDVKVIKFVDRADNLRDMHGDDPDWLRVYVQESIALREALQADVVKGDTWADLDLADAIQGCQMILSGKDKWNEDGSLRAFV